MGGNIFINYRRGDDPGFAQALFGRLEQVFKGDQLFMDIDDIAPGLDFVEVMNQQVARCDVLISVIGRGWLTAVDESGMRRLDDPQDFVRLEIESALAKKKRVIPVLVNDAKMPRLSDLPESLRPFARCNAVKLSHERFRADVAGLIQPLEEVLGEAAAKREQEEKLRAKELAEADAARRLEEERTRRAAKARKKDKTDRLEPAPTTVTANATVARASSRDGIVAWIAGLPSEIAWSIPLGVAGIFLLGWLLPGNLFSMRFAWGVWSALYGIAGLPAAGVALYARRDLLGGAELALYWYAGISSMAIIVLSAVNALGQRGNVNCDAVVLAIAVISAAPLLFIRREQAGGLEASVYWLGLTMVVYWALLPVITKLDWAYGASGAATVGEAYRAAALVLSGMIFLTAASICLWRRSKLSGPEIAVYLMGTAAFFIATLLLV